MKLVWKGKYENEEQLPKGNLPENAARFKEPETPAKLNLIASIFIIPVFIIVLIAVFTKILFNNGDIHFSGLNFWGIILAFLMILPHEFLHAIAFPKEAEVQVWYSLKNSMAFVISTCPTSKVRFIFLSLLPNIIFGFIPLLVWIFIPIEFELVSDIMFSFAFLSLLMGVGDYLNVFNAIIQMPKNSITQLSGFHSYWYMPKK